jgi:hypothetical protein
MPLKAKSTKSPGDLAANLAVRLTEELARERIVPRFVDSYVEQNGRYGLQVHAALYRDLLALLYREALLAITTKVMEMISKGGESSASERLKPLSRRDAVVFRQKYLSALSRQQKWNAGDALDFQTDLKMYEDIVARAATPQRRRKSFEVANHPFVDRCAFVLDSSFMEKARVAASQTLTGVEALAARLTFELLKAQEQRSAI